MKPINFQTLDLNLLRVFDEVMAERSLTRAAHNLSLTQPAVSNALRRLRELLGDDLLVRRGSQGMEPTSRAAELWPEVREAMAQLQRSLLPDRFDPATAEIAFVLAMADSTGAMLIPGLVAQLEREAPRVQLRVVPLTTRDPRGLLDDQAADIAIGHFPAVLADLTARSQGGQPVRFAHQQLYDGEYVCVMSASHRLARVPDEEFTIDAFCAERHMLVSFSGRPYGFIDEALERLGRTRRVMVTVNQFFTAGRVVAGSRMLTVLPRHLLPAIGSPDGLVWRKLPFPVPLVHVDALWHQRAQPSASHAWLRAALLRSVSRQADAVDGLDDPRGSTEPEDQRTTRR